MPKDRYCAVLTHQWITIAPAHGVVGTIPWSQQQHKKHLVDEVTEAECPGVTVTKKLSWIDTLGISAVRLPNGCLSTAHFLREIVRPTTE